MKKNILMAVFCLVLSAMSFAQVPQMMSYQAVVRGSDNNLVASQQISMRVSILQGSAEGEAVYTETHSATTNANGLISIEIGNGTSNDDFSTINWANGPYFVKTETDVNGGENYEIVGVSQLLSVPYAMYAQSAGNMPDVSGFLSEESQNLADVVALGNSANAQIKNVSDPTNDLDAVNLQTLNNVITEWSNILDSITYRYDSIIAYQDNVINNCLDSIQLLMGGFDEDGASRALFSVSETKQVRFSKGNLQYTTTGTHAVADGGTATGTWRFAEHQYDYIGEGNANISSTYTGWIDLFGWGTSGWNSGANAYQPWSTSNTNSDFCPGGSSENDLSGEYANADWGVYNAISNGGNTAGMWRTLTADEWKYVTRERPASTIGETQNGLFVRAQIVGEIGLIIFPDNYIHPNNVPIPIYVNDTSASFSYNIYSANQWRKIESAGAIFLPSAGMTTDTNTYGQRGFYWSSTAMSNALSGDISWSSSDTSNGFGHGGRHGGRSVRLVKDVE